jgi:hypothetical protein
MKKQIIKMFLVAAFTAVAGFNYDARAQVAWTLSQSVGNVDCYYSITQCGSDNVVFLKFVNNNSGSATISWNEVFTTQAGTGQQSGVTKQLTLAPGTTMQIDCADSSHPECLIGPADITVTYLAVISDFNFSNISVVN